MLHGNGAGSSRTILRAGQLARALGTDATVDLGWSTTTVTVADQAVTVRAMPTTIGMNRVFAVDQAIAAMQAGDASAVRTRETIRDAASLPLTNIWLFAVACAVGAAALALIFGADNWEVLALVAQTAGAGAFLRRGIGRLGASTLWQVGAAALLAGLVGAAAMRFGDPSMVMLVAVCPCMVLIPGPHLLNGLFDLAHLRIPLGLARLTFGALTLLAIGTGLMIGLAFGGDALPVDPPTAFAPLWLDVFAAGIVAVCYGIFYNAPLRILYWPLLVGAAVHALHWVSLEVWRLEPYVAAGIVCLVAGSILIPVSNRFFVPFSAIGFASVVSLVPGLLIFAALAAFTQLHAATGEQALRLVVGLADDTSTAALTLFAMAVGFLIPGSLLGRRWRSSEPPATHTVTGSNTPPRTPPSRGG